VTEQELIISIDEQRSVSIIPTKDGDGLVIALEDPDSIAIVEFKKPDVVALYEALEDWLKR
jgi:hypothetical protein